MQTGTWWNNWGADELYDIFGKYGSLRQVRRGNGGNLSGAIAVEPLSRSLVRPGPETRGTCFVVYDDIYDVLNTVRRHEHLILDAKSWRRKAENMKRGQKRDGALERFQCGWPVWSSEFPIGRPSGGATLVGPDLLQPPTLTLILVLQVSRKQSEMKLSK